MGGFYFAWINIAMQFLPKMGKTAYQLGADNSLELNILKLDG
jgi:hypothetical protein